MLSLRELSVGYPGTRGTVLDPVTLEAEPGSFVCVLGRNGAGKSTLMRTIAGLQSALGGTAELDGEEVASMRPAHRARRISVVLTERVFSPGLKVVDVVTLGRQPFTRWLGSLDADDRRIVDESLELAGGAAFRDRYFDDISDGERQRVLIARALAQSARLMVLDEITAFLDLPGRVETMSLLRRYARERKASVLLSSHDLDLSLELADRIWLLDGRGGLAVGSSEELIPAGKISAAFDTDEVSFSSESKRFELRA